MFSEGAFTIESRCGVMRYVMMEREDEGGVMIDSS